MPKETPHPFFRDFESATLSQRAIRSSVASVSVNALRFAVEIFAAMMLARLIGPTNYGVFGLAWPVLAFFFAIGSISFSTAALSQSTLTESQGSTLFWVNAGFGLAITTLCFALSPAAVWFYGDPRVGPVISAAGLVFLINGLTAQHEVMFVRSYRFKPLFVAEAVAGLLATAAAVAIAFLGLGYWALVAKFLLQPALRGAVIVIIAQWRPGQPNWKESRDLVRFGRNITGAAFLGYFIRNMDNVLVGHYCGAAVLGLYTISFRVLLLPVQQLTEPLGRVMIPSLSRLQEERTRYRQWFMIIVRSVALFVMPSMVVIGMVSRDFVYVLLGARWLQAAPILSWLAPAGAIQIVAAMTYWALLSSGRADRMVRWITFSAPFTVVAYAVGVHWGAEGVAAALLATNVLLFIPELWFNLSVTPLAARDVLVAAAPGTIAALGCAILVYFAQEHGFLGATSLIRLMGAAAITILVSSACALVVVGPRGLREVAQMVRSALVPR